MVCLQVSAAKLAIVIDDFGYRVKEDNQILALPAAVTIAILPSSPHGREVAEKAHQQGRDILIHMPMKPLSNQPLEKDTLSPSMSAEDIDQLIKNAIKRVPYAKGMNNHMGSEMTSSLPGMRNVMHSLSQSNLFFLDSVTIGNTQVKNAAKEYGVPTLRRHIFIDNHQSEEETRGQLNKAVAYARKHGSAVAIGHPHPSTVRALQKYLPQLPADIELVAVSSLLSPQPADKQPAKSLRMLSEEAKQPQNSESSTPPSATPEEEVQVQPEPEQEVTTVEAPPAELGLCEFETPKNKLQGIDFIMFVVEGIYHDKALQPLLLKD
ncbi:divergent polysaccharide deacetylase family protein [Providencia huaxiensis]|uniref:divergent polysaccharide deacetylase family protein n=1 Tax=Providencia TaxID=586 RepID=UPI001CFD9F4C|nr:MULTISPECIES: divergent polysaccharide deacetylase family protein [Providencia]MCB4826250.1 divergent polysaccharide deacetylase family protein [Providencia rettgeri]MCG5386248.1 divergent polysaccharide deacetylase family protein [Providencia rettgeri]MCG9947122.1 divergent polysaccharide deacetylase family protein [Providencia rettgeri]MCG9951736.1 divergent polysaccharide deacetylase family protein [Providencia rettgeri]MDW7801816.1 divergent polysaccharide deacetylase family protein [Pr